jgi:hypothetical protein
MVGAAGSAIQFVILLVLVTIFGAVVFLQAACTFVTIAQQTADGRDEVDWPREFWFDRVGKGLHMGWLVAFWLVPLGFLLRFLGPLPPSESAALYVGVPAGLFCLLFPVTLLSSFSASSPWVVLRLEVLGRMARRPAATAGFYLATAPLCLLGGAALYVTLAYRLFYVLPALATVLFLYARLVGRYARLLDRGRPGAAKKVDREVRRAARAAQVEDPWGAHQEEEKKERPKKKKKKRAAQAHDPWAVPEEEEPAETAKAGEVETYGIAEDKAPPPERREAKREPRRVKGYEVSPEPPPPRPKEVPLDGSPPIEERRIQSERETPFPDRPLLDGVWTFPWYRSSLGTWALLTLLFLGWGLAYAAMQAVRPF